MKCYYNNLEFLFKNFIQIFKKFSNSFNSSLTNILNVENPGGRILMIIAIYFFIIVDNSSRSFNFFFAPKL